MPMEVKKIFVIYLMRVGTNRWVNYALNKNIQLCGKHDENASRQLELVDMEGIGLQSVVICQLSVRGVGRW